MISVILPALNEEKTIGNVIDACINSNGVNEVIVIDDNSTDNTAAVAAEKGARVIISKKRGKGISMKEGLSEAKMKLLFSWMQT